MRVLMLGSDPSLFVPESAARARLRAYAEKIGELHVLSTAPHGTPEIVDGPLSLHPVSVSKLFRVGALTRRARALIGAHSIEIVSAQDPFEHGLAALRATRGTSAKLHIQVHTDFLSPWFVKSGNWRSPAVRMPLLNRYRLRIADQVLPEADGVRVVSKRVKDSLSTRFGKRIPEPIILPIAVDTNVPEPVRLPDHSFTFSLIAVGRLEPEKRIEDILAALALVVPRYPVAGLFIVGEGRERKKLEHLVRTLKLTDHVVFLGARADAQGLMQSAHAFIQASAYEGYGRTLIEAALVKIPIITTDVGIVGEVFKGYEDVLAAPVADPTELSLHMVTLMEDARARIELPMHAEAAAKAHLEAVGDLSTRIAEDLARLLA